MGGGQKSFPNDFLSVVVVYVFPSLFEHLRFSGAIPDSVFYWTSLNNLNLHRNMLRGHIPNAAASLAKLAHLDADQNGLQGPQRTAKVTCGKLWAFFCQKTACRTRILHRKMGASLRAPYVKSC